MWWKARTVERSQVGEYVGEDDQYVQEAGDYAPQRRWTQHPAVALLMATAIAGLLFLSYRTSIGSGSSSSTADDRAIESGSVSEDDGEAAASETDSSGGDDATEADAASAADGSIVVELNEDGSLRALPAPESGPYVSATLNLDAAPGNGLMVLTGRVPDQATAEAVRQAAEISYAPFVESQLEVDEALESAPWLDVAPLVIGLLPSVTDGTIMVADQQIHVAARSPNPGYLENLQGALTFFGQGVPVELVESHITDLTPPLFAVKADQNSVTLDGYVPSQSIIELLAGGAAAAYGPDQVTNNLTVDDGTYPSFWMQTMPGIFQLFRIFPGYEFTVQDGQFSGAIQGGVNFAVDSTEITAEAAQALDIGVAVLARDISIGMLVTGHTDSQGPEEYNQVLSTARAESVVEYFVVSGIDAARLVAAGAGESQPIADNETPEGRAQNRRVEFTFGPASSLGG